MYSTQVGWNARRSLWLVHQEKGRASPGSMVMVLALVMFDLRVSCLNFILL